MGFYTKETVMAHHSVPYLWKGGDENEDETDSKEDLVSAASRPHRHHQRLLLPLLHPLLPLSQPSITLYLSQASLWALHSHP